jgi:hypothetical protein
MSRFYAAALTFVLVAGYSLSPAPLSTQVLETTPPKVSRLLEPSRDAVLIAAGRVTRNIQVTGKLVVDVAGEAVECRAQEPTECSVAAELSGFKDDSELIGQLHGRLLILRNSGLVPVNLRSEHSSSDQPWRIAGRRVLRSGEIAVLAYDSGRQRWVLLGR